MRGWRSNLSDCGFPSPEVLPVALFAEHRSQLLPISALLLSLLLPGVAAAVELRDAELVPSGSPVLQNGTGTVRLEDSRLGRLGPLILVPEPGALWQLGSGIGLLALLAGRRRRRAASDTDPPEQPDRADPATPRRRML
jgi:hypothetical protein